MLAHGSEFCAFNGEDLTKYPPLKKEEEIKLYKRWLKNKDRKAFDKLVHSNLRYVIKCAHRYKSFTNSSSLSFNDLVQAGSMGLLRGLKTFDINKNCKVITYAGQWIERYIKECIHRGSFLVDRQTTGLTRSMYYKQGEFRQMLSEYDHEKREELRNKFAEKHNISKEKVYDLAVRLTAPESTVCFTENSEFWEDNDIRGYVLKSSKDLEGALSNKDEFLKIRKAIIEAKKRLKKEEQKLLSKRYGYMSKKLGQHKYKTYTLQQIADSTKSKSAEGTVCRERIRQIEIRTIGKLRSALKENKVVQEYCKNNNLCL